MDAQGLQIPAARVWDLAIQGQQGRVQETAHPAGVPVTGRGARLPNREARDRYGQRPHRRLAGHKQLRGLHQRRDAGSPTRAGECSSQGGRSPDVRGDESNVYPPQLAGRGRGPRLIRRRTAHTVVLPRESHLLR